MRNRIRRDTCRSCTGLYDLPDPDDDSDIALIMREFHICGYDAQERIRARENRAWNAIHRPRQNVGKVGWFRRLFQL